jgi:DNA-binding SARP family transcriptional activator
VPVDQLGFSLLGPVRAWHGHDELELGGPKRRSVLAVLLLNANRVVPQTMIIDGVWGGEVPAGAANLVHTYVSGLRRVLEPDRGTRQAATVLTKAPAGYVMRVTAGQLDLDIFHSLIAQAQACRDAGALSGAARAYAAAQSLWDGPPLAGIPGPLASTERARLTELRLAAVEAKAEVMLELGSHAELVGDLAALAAEYPLRERIKALLMIALHRCGRQAEALSVYSHTRTLLAEELGIDPASELQEVHQRVLAGDPWHMAASGVAKPAAAPVPRQLPSRSAHFVGRAESLRQLNALLDADARTVGTVMITAISGTAGIGKTALAVHWSHQIADRFPDGQLHANLRGFDPAWPPVHPADALRGFLDALGVPQERVPRALDAQSALYRSLLAGRHMLVLLDNARDAEQVRPLLPASPACLVVITSRNRLAGLHTQQGAQLLTLDRLSAEEAGALLARRVGAGRVAAEPQAVAELIESCERLPLALAIVAARAASQPSFPLMALAEELRQASTRLDALDAGEPLANLRTVLSWSIDALDDETAAVFGLLGSTPGPHISLPAAASLIAQPVATTQHLLRRLENGNLLQPQRPGRYRMHDLVRLYAAEQACHAGSQRGREDALRRLAGFYLHTAYQADRLIAPHRPPLATLGDLTPGSGPHHLPGKEAALAWLSSEYPCLMATQELAIARGWYQIVWQLAWALTTFHRRQGRLPEQVAAWQAALAAADQLADPAARALSHVYLGEGCAWAGNHPEALHHIQQALVMLQEAGDVSGQALAHLALTGAWERQGDDRRALAHAARGRQLYQACGNVVLAARALSDMGWYNARLGECDQAQALSREALVLHRQHRDREAVGATLDTLGYVALRAGDSRQALGYYRQALAVFRELGDSYQEAEILHCLAEAHSALGQQDQARATWQRALALYQAQHRAAEAERIEKLIDMCGR